MAYDGKIENFAPAQVDEVGQIILKARELLSDPAKWFKGSFVSEKTGAMCILGALGYRYKDGCGNRVVQEPARPYLQAADRIAYCLDDGDIASFNDYPKTTHADVLALLDRAAKSEAL